MDPSLKHEAQPSLGQLLSAEQGEGFRPRTRDDFKEEGLGNVRETSIALRKEELLRLLIAGKKIRQCCDILHLGPNTVRTYVRCPEFQMKLWNLDKGLWSRVDEELRLSKLSTIVRIQEMSEVALERIADLMESSTDESIVLRASQDVLDRNPETSKHSKQDSNSTVLVIDSAQLALAAQAAREMEARQNGYSYSNTGSGTVLQGDSTAEPL
jgi:hypothetical protein